MPLWELRTIWPISSGGCARRGRTCGSVSAATAGLPFPKTYTLCEELRVDYTLGLGMNAVLKRRSDDLLQEALRKYEETGQPQRLFTAFWYQAHSWSQARWTIVKAEAHAQGTNRRAVVTNRPGAALLPQATYDEYTERGESENRNKEFKCGLQADRLSDHRYMANLFRLYLHAAAANLLVRVRGVVADPPCPRSPHGTAHRGPGRQGSPRLLQPPS